MWNKGDISFFRKTLLNWFSNNKRDFPWRKEGVSGYELILSEILLQKTKASTVANYYNTFFNIYPDWEHLIGATADDLESILKPLGLFKHRANRLIKIINEYKEKNGSLPENVNELQDSNFSSLYISHAYEIFILKSRAALLDVNMNRVLSRYFDPRELKDVRNDKPMQELAQQVTNVALCKELNWAILDYAALVCTSRKPKCSECKLKNRCKFVQNGAFVSDNYSSL
jgi:A/G-specific adenine glycosylase